ncbi:MAG: HD domain-containing protein [Chloroflexi bacterium]|nr:MAG: HD domain-containing protein [Chloroflexota bacterium]
MPLVPSPPLAPLIAECRGVILAGISRLDSNASDRPRRRRPVRRTAGAIPLRPHPPAPRIPHRRTGVADPQRGERPHRLRWFHRGDRPRHHGPRVHARVHRAPPRRRHRTSDGPDEPQPDGAPRHLRLVPARHRRVRLRETRPGQRGSAARRPHVVGARRGRRATHEPRAGAALRAADPARRARSPRRRLLRDPRRDRLLQPRTLLLQPRPDPAARRLARRLRAPAAAAGVHLAHVRGLRPDHPHAHLLLRLPDPRGDRVHARERPHGLPARRPDLSADLRHRLQQTVRYLGAAGADERHANETARILRALGADHELVAAGLLHDRAKPAGTLLWHRAASVLLALLAPRVRARLASGDSTFARYLDHARRGAELARDDGASERVVRLIARHHERPETDDERLLARADREALP